MWIYSHSILFLFPPPRNDTGIKRLFWRVTALHRTAFMVLIQLPKDCSPVHACQTQRKGSLNDITCCFLSVQIQFMRPDAEKSEAGPGSEESGTSVLHWLHFQTATFSYSLTDVIQIFLLSFWLIISKIQLTIWGQLDTNIKNSTMINNLPQQLEWQRIKVRSKKKGSISSQYRFIVHFLYLRRSPWQRGRGTKFKRDI